MATKEDIQHHYDVDNEFYKLFLDKAYMAYSCGVWENAVTLEEAQENKLRRLARYANLQAGDKLLDIGCGWGGMMQYALNRRHISSAHGITLSQHQYNYMSDVDDPRVSTDLLNWIDLDSSEKFDSIISIGAFEHFSSLKNKFEKNQTEVYRSFFEKCWEVSSKESHLGLQTIVLVRAPKTKQEISDVKRLLHDVFPGSSLPTITEIQDAISGLYEICELKLIGADYTKTLGCWFDRLDENKTEAAHLYGNETLGRYKKYFEAAGAGFESGMVDLLQVSLRKVPSPLWYQ